MIGKLKQWFLHTTLGMVKQRTFSQFYGADSQNIATEFTISKRTPLCKLMTYNGSDKGKDWHNYTKVYHQLLQGKDIKAVFELGIGTTNENIDFNMGAHGTQGASLRAWRSYFPSADIFAADIDRNCLIQEDRISAFYCDQTDKASIEALWQNPQIPTHLDFIIDDGYHAFQANKTFFENSIHKLNKDGVFVVEDIPNMELGKWDSLFTQAYLAQYPDLCFQLCSIPNIRNALNNNLLIVKRK